MRVCVFDAWHPDTRDPDDPLVNSHWVAGETIARLRDMGIATVEMAGAEFTRGEVLAALARVDHDGFMYFGHGSAHLLFRETEGARKVPIPLVAREDLEAVGRRFFVAFACLSGEELGMAAAAAGVSAYLGYRQPIVVSWTHERLPRSVVTTLSELTTEGSCMVASGTRSRSEIRARMRALSDALLEQLDILAQSDSFELATADHWALVLLAGCLHEHFVLEGVDVVP